MPKADESASSLDDASDRVCQAEGLDTLSLSCPFPCYCDGTTVLSYACFCTCVCVCASQEDRWSIALAEGCTLSDLVKAVECIDQRIRARSILSNQVSPAQQRRLLQLQLCCDQCWKVAEKTVRALQSDLEETTAAHHREADAHLHLQQLCSELEKTFEQSESAARDQRLNAAQAVSLLKGEVARMQDEMDRADREHAVQIERLAQVAAQGEERLLAELQMEKQWELLTGLSMASQMASRMVPLTG